MGKEGGFAAAIAMLLIVAGVVLVVSLIGVCCIDVVELVDPCIHVDFAWGALPLCLWRFI
jgi:hypothetical protein